MSTITAIPRPAAAPSTAPAVQGEERHVMHGASWDFYDWLTDSLGERSPFRVAYDGRDIEIMTLGPKHENTRDLLSAFVGDVALWLNIHCKGLGLTTWKRSAQRRGVEADQCYYFDAAKIQACDAAAARGSNDVADYPNPDLVIEVDISPSRIDRPGIYSALQVFEVWRFENEKVSIEKFGADGTYATVESSQFLHVRGAEIDQWLSDGKTEDRRQWRQRLQEWVKTTLKPRIEPA